MNMNQQNYNEGLPPELAAIAAALDELARAEGAAAGPCVEDRLFLETRARLAQAAPELGEAEAALNSLASVERRGASPTLEDRIFVASRGALRREQHQRVEVRTRRVFALRGLRVAASFLIAGAAFFGYLVLRQGEAPETGPGTLIVSTTALESQIDDHMQEFSAAVQVAFSGSDAEKSKTSLEGMSDHDGDWFHIDEFFDKEGSL